MSGFEYDGTFYRWHSSTKGKDLMLIDRFSNMPLQEFFELVADGVDRGRAPVLLTLIATSIRHEHPDWSIERIVRAVQELDVGELVFIDPDEEEIDQLPPVEAGETTEPTGGTSPSPSRSSYSEPAPETSETFSVTRD